MHRQTLPEPPRRLVDHAESRRHCAVQTDYSRDFLERGLPWAPLYSSLPRRVSSRSLFCAMSQRHHPQAHTCVQSRQSLRCSVCQLQSGKFPVSPCRGFLRSKVSPLGTLGRPRPEGRGAICGALSIHSQLRFQSGAGLAACCWPRPRGQCLVPTPAQP